MLDLAGDAAPALGFEPTVVFDGPVDTATPRAVAEDLEATAREALANVARHAAAHHVEVRVTVRDGDAGAGGHRRRHRTTSPGHPRGHGLDNMTHRAARHHGTFQLRAGPTGGTQALWRVPVD